MESSLKNPKLENWYSKRPHLMVAALIICMSTYGCQREASTASNEDATLNNKSEESSPDGGALPPCPGVDASILNYRFVKISESEIWFQNKDASSNSMKAACKGQSVGFGRYLMSDGTWLNQRDRLSSEMGGKSKIVAAANVVVMAVKDRSFKDGGARLSETGVIKSFEGVAFSRWNASAQQMAEFNLQHENRKIGVESEWSVNNTNDDSNGRPIHISCSPGDSSERKGDDLYLNAGRTASDASSMTAFCQTWFGVNVGTNSRAIVKVDIGGQVHKAAVVIENVRRELQAQARENQE